MVKYDSYKDSRVEWIGKIPSHWKVTKIKSETSIVVDGTHFTPNYIDEGIPFLRVTDIQTNEIDLTNVKFISKEEHEVLIQRCNPQRGDLLLSKNGTIGITKIVDWDWDFSIFVSICLIRFKSSYNPYFFSYLFQSNIVDQQIKESSKQSTVTNLHLDKIRELLIIHPPTTEQHQIVQYLDSQTTLIDTLIQKTQEKITLLREKRTSLINHTVTKGLNPDVEKKDSGVEWIGEIPKHWEITKVKYQFNVEGGGTPSKEKKEYWDGDIPWVSPKDMKSDEIVDSEDKITELGLKNSTSKLIQPNSLLIVVRSGILQRTIPISINQIPVSINQDLKSLTPKNDFPIKFTYYFIKGNEINLLKDWSKEGTTVESIEMEFMTNSTIPFPPKSEQTLIIEYLEEQTKRIDTLVQKEEKRVELLKEYRQTLISDVVTGKIKVTDYE